MAKTHLTTTVVSELAWNQLTQMDSPSNSPVASTVAGVAPVQSWEETDQVLPDIGQVDNVLLAAAGLSNTILISTATAELLATITVSIGANGNWFVGATDTGVPAKGTDESTIVRPSGIYGTTTVYRNGDNLVVGAGLLYGVKEGDKFYTLKTSAETTVALSTATTFVTIDRFGTVRSYDDSINLWLIPESQALLALVIDSGSGGNVYAVPTVHNAMLMATAVIPYSQEAITAAQSATTQALLALQYSQQAETFKNAAEGAQVLVAADAQATAQNLALTEQYKNAAAASEQAAHNFADYADADRVATNADRVQVAADKAAVASDKSTVATDKGIVAADKSLVLGYKNDALASKNLALEYAIKPENSLITGTLSDYSALHWAAKAQQWAQAVSSALVWKGQWSAASNTAPPTPAVGSGAHFYRISAAGTINSVSYEVGDYIHWDPAGLVWFKIDGTDAVMTVNGIPPVGGNVSITTIIGNAGTATKLQTARTIGGVSFDGSANINLPGVNAAGNQNTTGNAATATKLATARNIAGNAFDGTADITIAAADVGAVPTTLLEVGSGEVMRADGARAAAIEEAANKSSFRNKVQNGNMIVAQRGDNFILPINTTTYGIDRFLVANYTPARGTVKRIAVDASYPNPAINKCLAINLTTAVGATVAASSHTRIAHIIEGYDVLPLVAEPFVLKFTVKTSVAGKYSVALRNNGRLSTVLKSYTLAANVWTKVEFKVSALPASFFNNLENGLGLEICWTLVSGTDFINSTEDTPVAGVWLAVTGQVLWGTSASDYFYLTEIQLEAGTNSTEFDHRPFPLELALCQRHYCATFPYGTNPAPAAGLQGALFYTSYSSGGGGCTWKYPVTMRALPAITSWNPVTPASSAWRNVSYSLDHATAASYAIGTSQCDLLAAVSHTVASFNFIHVTASAELL